MAGTGTTLNLSGYKLTFDDEFNSYDLNNGGTQPGVWNTYFTGYNVRTLSGNGEQEYYSDPSVGVNPFSQQNGELTITASPGSNSAGLPYNSGMINTEGVFSQTYGYFEMRAELPQGKGMWPAFWMLPTSNGWPPELDALEAFGQTNANGEGGSTQYHVGEISANSSQSNGGWETVPANIYNSYNTYGVKWTPENVTYYFDGQQVAQFTTPADMSQAMYLIANLAAGGNWPGDPNGETAQMKIDYIRAFSDSSSATAVNLQTVSAPDGSTSADMADFTDGASAKNVAAGQSATPTPTPTPTPAPSTTPTPTPSTGSTPTPTPTPTPAPASTPTPTTTSGGTVGSGPDQIVLHLAEDAYQGNAMFVLTVDGKQIGGTQSVTASHMAGDSETFTFDGNFGAGTHDIGVTFTNDLWAGTTATDRNLYIDSITYDGKAVPNSSVPLYSDGTANFTVTEAASPSPAPAPSPDPSPSPAPSTGASPTPSPSPAPATSDVAHATPVEARDYVAPNASGTAHGTTGADDIYVTGPGQTVITNGGDDIINIGTYTDTKIIVTGTGVTTVSTWSSQYTLASGVDNLDLQGSYAHTAHGNGLDNYIVASSGNDTIIGGGGNVTIQVGTGSDTLTGGGHDDMFVFTNAADHNDVITDFHEGHDTLDFRTMLKDAGYAGTNPVGDHVLQIAQHGSDTVVSLEAPGSTTPHVVATLQNVVASSLHPGTDYLVH